MDFDGGRGLLVGGVGSRVGPMLLIIKDCKLCLVGCEGALFMPLIRQGL